MIFDHLHPSVPATLKLVEEHLPLWIRRARPTDHAHLAVSRCAEFLHVIS
uniref:Uncharacterized protein n=1 Tax=Arundo donax TaxID=35708 RepID=A0A0A9B5F1_ARUDO